MGALGRTLRYLGLGGGDSESLADLTTPGGRPDPDAVGAGLTFRGELAGDGDFHIAGRFEGDINVTGRVLVGEGAEVDANINARAIVVGGTVRGNLSATTRVETVSTPGSAVMRDSRLDGARLSDAKTSANRAEL